MDGEGAAVSRIILAAELWLNSWFVGYHGRRSWDLTCPRCATGRWCLSAWLRSRRAGDVLVAALAVVALGCGCASRGHRNLDEPQVPMRGQAPHVVLSITERMQHRDITSVHLLAILHGEPDRFADWYCLTPEWYAEGRARLPRPEHHGPCGELVPSRSWEHWIDLLGGDREHATVYVVLWDRRGHAIATDHRDVPLLGSRMGAR